MVEYDPAVDGIGIEQMNTNLQEKLNQCFQHIENYGDEQSLKQEIYMLKVQINLLARLLRTIILDQVVDQVDLERLNILIEEHNP